MREVQVKGQELHGSERKLPYGHSKKSSWKKLYLKKENDFNKTK